MKWMTAFVFAFVAMGAHANNNNSTYVCKPVYNAANDEVYIPGCYKKMLIEQSKPQSPIGRAVDRTVDRTVNSAVYQAEKTVNYHIDRAIYKIFER